MEKAYINHRPDVARRLLEILFLLNFATRHLPVPQ